MTNKTQDKDTQTCTEKQIDLKEHTQKQYNDMFAQIQTIQHTDLLYTHNHTHGDLLTGPFLSPLVVCSVLVCVGASQQTESTLTHTTSTHEQICQKRRPRQKTKRQQRSTRERQTDGHTDRQTDRQRDNDRAINDNILVIACSVLFCHVM